MQIVKFKRRAVFSKPAILKKNRKNIFVKKGTLGELLDADTRERTARVRVEGKDNYYIFDDIPFDAFERVHGEIEHNPLLPSGGLLIYGYIHKSPAEVKSVSHHPEKLPRRKAPRITPKTPRLRR